MKTFEDLVKTIYRFDGSYHVETLVDKVIVSGERIELSEACLWISSKNLESSTLLEWWQVGRIYCKSQLVYESNYYEIANIVHNQLLQRMRYKTC